MEERLEDANVAGPLASPHNWQDMESLVVWCRAAAALQPDGTDVPATRCEVCTAYASTPYSYVYVQHQIGLQLPLVNARFAWVCMHIPSLLVVLTTLGQHVRM